MTLTESPAPHAVGVQTEFDRAGLEILTDEQCLALLPTVPVGRIVFTEGALPAVQPVNFVVDGRCVIIRAMTGSKLAVAAAGAVVAFEVDEYDATTETGWSVTAVGQATVVTDPAELDRVSQFPLRSWAGRLDHVIQIHIALLRGRRLLRT
ncbi:pyridoxamine 5'-phosphate oxidase family protein [Kribbella monticola]|uniref:pyridoxamine 5'-phosphate oxidase family protein n=1 Tax=Kribbella monticola TaxID=2185285 RepID=UPI001E4F4E9E|nr:pyridoxamine 5'-phosphate oxidase family protein [Kribbella monticola]